MPKGRCRMILGRMDFRTRRGGWVWPEADQGRLGLTRAGCVAEVPRGERITLAGPGVHTRSGDSIELHFETARAPGGSIVFGYEGGFEWVYVELQLRRRRAALFTSECNRRQPVASAPLTLEGRHVLRIDKAEGPGGLVRSSNVRVRLDGREVLAADGLDVVPEMGVFVRVCGARVVLRRFVHRGRPSGVPEHLHVGGWQMLNRPDIDENLASIRRGLRAAAEEGVQLLVTPETSLTGLFGDKPVTRRRGPIAEAERRLRRFLRRLTGAPYLVVGLPVWDPGPGGPRAGTRYNVSRLYGPDGHVVADGAKVHS
ncbi:MAG: hypothetical protein ACYS5V_12845, partial [Planctomycetota bacterium]